ncbi:MAG: hypothetical protein IH944_02845 [Armatimonadetes bacterium]|nr:hypothetical protein [Armatimonadota bacterium]
MTELEAEFHVLMRSIYDRAKSECKYNATRFMRMLEEHQGLETAHILLRAPEVSHGFVELYMRKRIDLTVEAQILANEKFWPLFTETELDTARRWLKQYDYSP